MIDINVSTIFQIVNFLFLLWVLNLLLYRPIRKILIERKEKIEGLKKGFGNLENKLISQKDGYQAGIKEARVEGMRKKALFVEDASQEEKNIISKINERAKTNLLEIRQQIASDSDKASKELEKEIDSYAKAIGEKILGRAC